MREGEGRGRGKGRGWTTPQILSWLRPGCVCILADLDGAGSEERRNDGNHVDSELELQELGDTVIDIATPHHRLHYAREIIVG